VVRSWAPGSPEQPTPWPSPHTADSVAVGVKIHDARVDVFLREVAAQRALEFLPVERAVAVLVKHLESLEQVVVRQ
jgi:hypothetical protein